MWLCQLDNLLENSSVVQLTSQAKEERHVLLLVLSGSSLSSIKTDRGLCLCVISTCTPIWQSMASVFVLVGYMKLSVNRSVNEPRLFSAFYRNVKNTGRSFFRHPIKRALVSNLYGWMDVYVYVYVCACSVKPLIAKHEWIRRCSRRWAVFRLSTDSQRRCWSALKWVQLNSHSKTQTLILWFYFDREKGWAIKLTKNKYI